MLSLSLSLSLSLPSVSSYLSYSLTTYFSLSFFSVTYPSHTYLSLFLFLAFPESVPPACRLHICVLRVRVGPM